MTRHVHIHLPKMLDNPHQPLVKTYYSEYLMKQDMTKMKRAGYKISSQLKQPEGSWDVTYVRGR